MLESYSADHDRKLEPLRVIPLRPAEEAAVQAAEIKKYIEGKNQPLNLDKNEFDELKRFNMSLIAKRLLILSKKLCMIS